jgi:hypothetical protein
MERNALALGDSVGVGWGWGFPDTGEGRRGRLFFFMMALLTTRFIFLHSSPLLTRRTHEARTGVGDALMEVDGIFCT